MINYKSIETELYVKIKEYLYEHYVPESILEMETVSEAFLDKLESALPTAPEKDEGDIDASESHSASMSYAPESFGIPVEYDKIWPDHDEASVDRDEAPVDRDEAMPDHDEAPVVWYDAPADIDGAPTYPDEAPAYPDEVSAERYEEWQKRLEEFREKGRAKARARAGAGREAAGAAAGTGAAAQKRFPIPKEETFSEMLLRLIRESSMTEPDAYRKAWVDRRVFSKIRSNPDYTPLKKTAVAFALALELDRRTADELLMKAGYALSNSSEWDLLIRYCIENKIFHLYDVNCILNDFEQPLLG